MSSELILMSLAAFAFGVSSIRLAVKNSVLLAKLQIYKETLEELIFESKDDLLAKNAIYKLESKMKDHFKY